MTAKSADINAFATAVTVIATLIFVIAVGVSLLTLAGQLHDTPSDYCFSEVAPPRGAEELQLSDARLNVIPLAVSCTYTAPGKTSVTIFPDEELITCETIAILALIGAVISFLVAVRAKSAPVRVRVARN